MVEPDVVEEVLRNVEGQDVRVEVLATRFLDPVSIAIVIGGGAVAVAAALSTVERLRGGQVIDLRDDAPRTTYRTRDLHYGMILIRVEGGGYRLVVHQPDELLQDVLQAVVAVLGPGSAPAPEIGEKVQQIAGNFGGPQAVQADRLSEKELPAGFQD